MRVPGFTQCSYPVTTAIPLPEISPSVLLGPNLQPLCHKAGYCTAKSKLITKSESGIKHSVPQIRGVVFLSHSFAPIKLCINRITHCSSACSLLTISSCFEGDGGIIGTLKTACQHSRFGIPARQF